MTDTQDRLLTPRPEPCVTGAPRIAPGNQAQIGRLNTLVTRALGLAAGTPPPNLFTTLARHRPLFRRWLRFAGTLMPGGSLRRTDTELVILRVAHLSGCQYEWRHHQSLAAAAGLSPEEIERVREGSAAPAWNPHQGALLRAVDELHETREIVNSTWADLRESLSETELIELLMLIGHYEMLAMVINGLRIESDRPVAAPSVLGRSVQALARRRTG